MIKGAMHDVKIGIAFIVVALLFAAMVWTESSIKWNKRDEEE